MSHKVLHCKFAPAEVRCRHLPARRLPRLHAFRPTRPVSYSKRHCLLCQASASNIASGLPDLLPQSTPDDDFEAQHGYPLSTQASNNGAEPMRLAHWLIPQRVLLGRYPFVHHQNSNRKHAEHQIKSLLQSGVTTFVCLQAELPPHDEMKTGGFNGFVPYKAVATMLHSSMNGQPDADITASIRNRHLDQFLPQKRSANQQSRQDLPKGNLQFLHFPIQDLSIPSQDKVDGLIDNLISRLQKGEILYLHCWGGRGRAGTIGACLLRAIYGISGDEALQRVQRSFATRSDVYTDGTTRESPETEEQREFVRQFDFK